MTFEQPASLNRYVVRSGQSGWSFRWELFKSFLPASVFLVVLVGQTILLQDWERDRWELPPFLVIPGLLLLIFFSIEFEHRVNAKRKRVLKLDDDNIHTGFLLQHQTRWQQIVSWRFNHIADEPNYHVATMEYKLAYRWGFKDKKLRRYRIVLEKSQADQLISELKLRQQKNNLSFSIVDEEANFIQKNVSLAKACVDAAGVLLLMEGVLFFMASFGVEDNSPDPDFNPNLHGSFAKFMRTHFSSGAEFRNFLLVTGTILGGSGLVLMIWSRLVMTEKTQPIDCH